MDFICADLTESVLNLYYCALLQAGQSTDQIPPIWALWSLREYCCLSDRLLGEFLVGESYVDQQHSPLSYLRDHHSYDSMS